MNLKEASIGNIHKIISDFVDRKDLSNKKKKEIAEYISAVAINAFCIGYQVAYPSEISAEQFNASVSAEHKTLCEAINELIFQVSI